MRVVVVRYKVKPSKLDEHLALVRAVFTELGQAQKTSIRYAAIRGSDGVSFTHVAQIEAETGNPLASLASFQAFQRNIAARCDEPPAGTDVEVVGNHGLFWLAPAASPEHYEDTEALDGRRSPAP